MSITKLKKLLKVTNNELQKEVIQYYIEAGKEYKLHLQDVLNYGCVSGAVSHLIYYKDTNDFYKKYKTEIWDLLQEDKENQGYKNILEFIGSLNGSDNVGSEAQLFNLLSWYAFESVSDWISCELEL